MCGIAGYISKKSSKETIKKTIDVLKKLEYRGYDSSGIAYQSNNEYIIQKKVGKINDLINEINLNTSTKLAIAQTRWATHGKINLQNAHPHEANNVILVHNGIIENYQSIKEKLIQAGYQFYSETDSEVVVKLIDYYYLQYKNKIKTLKEVINQIKGSYAFLIIFKDDEAIYTISKDMPLIIAIDHQEGFVLSSDINSLPNNIKEYYSIDQNIVQVEPSQLHFYKQNGQITIPKINKIVYKQESTSKGNYETFMLKEIHEQPKLINDFIQKWTKNGLFDFNLNKSIIKLLKTTKKVRIIGCGSAYHAGMLLSSLIKRKLEINAESLIASEFRYENFISEKNTINIVISQSGETADTIAATKIIKNHHQYIITLTNNKNSTIAKMGDMNLDLNCGIEYAVASTKAYSSQCIIGHLFIIYWSYLLKKINKSQMLKIITNLKKINIEAAKILDTNISSIVKMVINAKNILFIGKGIDLALANEAALKFKEITYLNSNAYAAGELKHGNIALIDSNSVIIAIITKWNKEIANKTINSVKEAKARGANVVYFSSNQETEYLEKDDILLKFNDSDKEFSYLPIIYWFQLLAYFSAKKLNRDIDCPRNLAKAVTVE